MVFNTHSAWMPYPKDFCTYNNDEFTLPETFYHDYSKRKAASGQEKSIYSYYQPVFEKLQVDKLSGKALAEWIFRRYMIEYLNTAQSMIEILDVF